MPSLQRVAVATGLYPVETDTLLDARTSALYSPQSMVNRRLHPRIEYHERVEIKLHHVDGHPDLKDKNLLGLSADISEGGVGLRLDKSLPVGTELKLRIFIPDPPSAFMHRGVVRWTLKDEEGKNFFIGIEFAGASPE